MTSYPIDAFRAEILNEPIETADDLAWYLGRAARLAAMGDRAAIAEWPRRASALGLDVASVIVDRAERGLEELATHAGEDLGMTLVDAQDYRCLLDLDRDLLPPHAVGAIERWIDEAEETDLDEDAATFLEDFAERFPIPATHRLDVVSWPTSPIAEALIASQFVPPPTRTLQPVQRAEPALVAADGRPSEAMRQRFRRLVLLDQRDDLPTEARTTLEATLDSDWRVVAEIRAGDDWDDRATSLRLGPVAGTASEDGTVWEIDLRPFELKLRLNAINEGLCLHLATGERLLF